MSNIKIQRNRDRETKCNSFSELKSFNENMSERTNKLNEKNNNTINKNLLIT